MNPNRNYPPYLHQILPEIDAVPLEKRKYLSPIFLYCSLGHTPGANPFSEYRTLVGTVNYSKNFHFLSLYSGILGAYLNTPMSNQSTLPIWFDNSISNATDWLKENNSYLCEYLQMIPNMNNQFPTATHSSADENMLPSQHDFQRIGRNCLLMALTGITAQNIGGATIHSTLRIIYNEFGFCTLIF
ncbi:16048_t:CDS:2 [Cetraspora pellucida]|uniref:16048_t:CDS:1 n=1 Tax=Cetraspora pellucida TaxID=1433469 RepID=A0ACA9L656_9GLOM|nr:16048_t:CDS:2 [Cetraspora pellucida]